MKIKKRRKRRIGRILVFIWRVIISFLVTVGTINQFQSDKHIDEHCILVKLLYDEQTNIVKTLNGVCLYIMEIEMEKDSTLQSPDKSSENFIRVNQ